MAYIYDALARGFRYPEPEMPYDHPNVDEPPPRRPLGLEPGQVASLVHAIDAGLREHGCDNTLRAAKAWARREKVRWAWLRDQLEDRGGFCDCEVLMNVVPLPDDSGG
jgi:hypothetical protein